MFPIITQVKRNTPLFPSFHSREKEEPPQSRAARERKEEPPQLRVAREKKEEPPQSRVARERKEEPSRLRVARLPHSRPRFSFHLHFTSPEGKNVNSRG